MSEVGPILSNGKVSNMQTLESIANFIRERLPDLYEGKDNAEADGTSEYDYYEGLIDAYEVILTKIESNE